MTENIEKICKQWLFSKKSLENTPTLDYLHTQFKDADFSALILAFTTRLKTVPCEFSKSEQVSGSICFFGGVFTSLLNYGYIENIEGLFTFALCYMLIDHFLDDKNISDEEKNKCMKEIYAFIHDDTSKIDNNHKSDNKLINAAAERYFDLLKTAPQCREYIIKLFKSELKGVEIQKRKDLPREIYLQIAEEKGGLTAAVIASIIGLTDENESMKLGALIQLVDDVLDIGDDNTLNIYTLARFDIDNKKLDNYVIYTIIKIHKLSNIYNFFKPILLLGIILGIHDNPGNISPELNEILQYYNPFSKETSKDSLNLWFHNKLYSYIDKNNI